MVDDAPAEEKISQLGPFRKRFRANLEESMPMVVVLGGLAVAATYGCYLLIRKAGPWDGARIGCVLLLAGVAAVCLFGVRFYWRASRRGISLHDNGLAYFDGLTTYAIPWSDIAEIYEVVSGVKVLGFSVGQSKPEVTAVTEKGVQVRIDKTILGREELAPIVSSAATDLLRQRVKRRLDERQPVTFGCLSLSEKGIVIEKAPSRSIVGTIQYQLETDMDDFEARPGDYPWEEIRDIRITTASSDTASYNQIEIYVNGHKFPAFLCGIPEFPNFSLFAETLRELKHPFHGEAE